MNNHQIIVLYFKILLINSKKDTFLAIPRFYDITTASIYTPMKRLSVADDPSSNFKWDDTNTIKLIELRHSEKYVKMFRESDGDLKIVKDLWDALARELHSLLAGPIVRKKYTALLLKYKKFKFRDNGDENNWKYWEIFDKTCDLTEEELELEKLAKIEAASDTKEEKSILSQIEVKIPKESNKSVSESKAKSKKNKKSKKSTSENTKDGDFDSFYSGQEDNVIELPKKEVSKNELQIKLSDSSKEVTKSGEDSNLNDSKPKRVRKNNSKNDKEALNALKADYYKLKISQMKEQDAKMAQLTGKMENLSERMQNLEKSLDVLSLLMLKNKVNNEE